MNLHDRNCACEDCRHLNASVMADVLGWIAVAVVAGLIAALVISTLSLTHGLLTAAIGRAELEVRHA
jgi:uncharacterized membrane protein YkgB